MEDGERPIKLQGTVRLQVRMSRTVISGTAILSGRGVADSPHPTHEQRWALIRIRIFAHADPKKTGFRYRFACNNFQPRRGYRISEAAVYMGVSPWFIEEKIRAKELPALRLCRHYTILKEDMDAFLDMQRRAAA